MLAMLVLVAGLAANAPANPLQPAPPISQQQRITNSQAPKDHGEAKAPLYVKAECDKGCGYAEDPGYIEKLKTDPVAGFTLVLALFTIWLAFATRKAARAAADAADALPVVERAYVYPVIGAESVNHAIREAIPFYITDTKDDVPALVFPEIQFAIKNLGKTPAVIKSVKAACGIVGTKSFIDAIHAPDKPILGERDQTRFFTAAPNEGFSRNQAKKIIAKTELVRLIGTVQYWDIWNVEWWVTFDFVWNNDEKRMVLDSIKTQKRKPKPKGWRAALKYLPWR